MRGSTRPAVPLAACLLVMACVQKEVDARSLRRTLNETGRPILPVSSHVTTLSLSGCSAATPSAPPILSFGPVAGPLFLQLGILPDVVSSWDIILVDVSNYSVWKANQFAGLPGSYSYEHSVIDAAFEGKGSGVEYGQTNVFSVLSYYLVLRVRATERACFDDSYRDSNFIVFESMPKACPIVVTNPPSLHQTKNSEVDKKIVGGSIVEGSGASTTNFKWMASIWATSKGDATAVCGGSQIAPGFVLTAAHCNVQEQLSAYKVRIGAFELNDGSFNSIKRIWVHPGYAELKSGTVINDLAIMQLNKPDPSKANDTIAWNTKSEFPPSDEYVTTAGWGRVSQGWVPRPDPNYLQRVDMPVWDSKRCNNIYAGSLTTDFHICAGATGGGCDSCQFVLPFLNAFQYIFLPNRNLHVVVD
jgi:Trypsin